MPDDLHSPPEATERPRVSARAVLRKNLSIIATVILFGAGMFALYRLLAPLDLAQVLASLRATPRMDLVPAILATVLGYAALIGYDWSALRYIGKPLPLPFVGLGGFLGYALGNTIGLSAVSGAAVRYRIYAALGLDGYDVAAIASFAAISYGLGATMIGLGALVVHPAALSSLLPFNPASIQLAAAAGLAAMLGTLGWIAVRGGALRLGRFSLRAPSLADMVRQMAITFADICMATIVLFVLLPPDTLPFTTLLAVFAIATMAGVASHVPGGVGVFESVVIAALPRSVSLSDAVTALLLFRMIYFLLPFVIALATLSLIEIWTATGRRTPAMTALLPVLNAGRAIIPMATGMLVLGSGLFMMFAGLFPNPDATLDDLETFLPLAMLHGGAMVSSVFGSLLVVLSLGLFRRSRAAFWLVLGALGVGIAISLTRPAYYDRVLMLGFMAIVLWPCRREFYRAARIAQGLWSTQWVAFMFAVTGAGLLTFYAIHESAPFATLTWWQFALDAEAAEAQRSLLAAGVVLSAALLFSALRARRVTMTSADSAAMDRARTIIDRHGRGTDMLALTGEKMLMFDADDEAVVAYGIRGASWIALAAPIGPERARADLAWEFHDAARANGARPVFYEAPVSFTAQAIDMGLALHKMGEEAVVDLATFTLDGPHRKRLRTTHARALRDGLSLSILRPPHDAALLAELRGISDTWLAERGAREKTFSVGRFDTDYLQRCPLAVVRHEGWVVGFANLLIAEGRRSVSVDLMRQRADSPTGTMEFLFTELMLRLSSEGYREFSLGMVPFAGLTARSGSDLWTRFGALVYQHGDRFYNFDGLRRFKAKFDPEWRPRYFCCRSVLPPVAPLADAARLIAGTARGLEND